MNTSANTSATTTVASGSDAITPEQQRLVERIATQRERLRARRAARLQSLVPTERSPVVGTSDASFLLRAFEFTRVHPIAVAALAGGALLAGPRRLIRWGGVLLPLVMRLRR